MADPNFETPSRPGPREFGVLPGNPRGADVQLEPSIGQQLGQDPGSPENVDTAQLRRFVKKEYQIISLDLSGARTNEFRQFQREYSFIWIPASTNIDDEITLRLDSASADPIPFLAGSKLNGIPFEAFYITNTAIASATMKIMVAENWPVDQINTDG